MKVAELYKKLRENLFIKFSTTELHWEKNFQIMHYQAF